KASNSTDFAISDNGGAQWFWAGNSNSATTGFVDVKMNTAVPLSGIALVAERVDGILVAEAGISAAPSISSGRTYVNLNAPMTTAISFANTNSQNALISFYFTDTGGNDFGYGTFTLTVGQQMSAFLNQPPFNAPSSMEGTFTFSSSNPVGAVSLQGLTNEAGNFLYTTLPMAPVSGPTPNPVIVPDFADGGGWKTQVILINPSDGLVSGM